MSLYFGGVLNCLRPQDSHQVGDTNLKEQNTKIIHILDYNYRYNTWLQV